MRKNILAIKKKKLVYSNNKRSEFFSDPLGEKSVFFFFNFVLEIMLNIKEAKKKYLAQIMKGP